MPVHRRFKVEPAQIVGNAPQPAGIAASSALPNHMHETALGSALKIKDNPIPSLDL
jgi:hypothetical protein